MARVRTGWLALVAACGLLPGCATPSRGVRPADAEPVPAVASPAAVPGKASGFAELIRAPGKRVPRLPAAEPPAPAAPAVPAVVKPAEPVVVRVAPAPPPDAPLVAAVRAYLDGKPDLAAEQLKALDKPNQEVMQQLLPPVVALSQLNFGRAGPVDYGVLAGQVETPLKSLAAKGPLHIAKAVFCSNPEGFGQYRPLPDGHVYRPGHVAEVYVEVRNAPSVPVRRPEGGEWYVTHLNTALRMRDAAGAAVELTGEDRRPAAALQSEQRDYSRSPVRDYAKAFRVPVPRRPGRYTLTVEFSDPKTGRAVSQGMSFDVGGS